MVSYGSPMVPLWSSDFIGPDTAAPWHRRHGATPLGRAAPGRGSQAPADGCDVEMK